MNIIPLIPYNSENQVQTTEGDPQGFHRDCAATAQIARWSTYIRQIHTSPEGPQNKNQTLRRCASGSCGHVCED